MLVKDKIEWTIQRLLDVLGKKARFSLSTNGLALTEDVIDWICSYPKFVVNVPIDPKPFQGYNFHKWRLLLWFLHRWNS